MGAQLVKPTHVCDNRAAVYLSHGPSERRAEARAVLAEELVVSNRKRTELLAQLVGISHGRDFLLADTSVLICSKRRAFARREGCGRERFLLMF